MSNSNKKWFEAYKKWQAGCKAELLEMGHDVFTVDGCDVNEDGSVYFGNMSETEKNYVTAWENSPHFLD